jgi:hypothetical protein
MRVFLRRLARRQILVQGVTEDGCLLIGGETSPENPHRFRSRQITTRPPLAHKSFSGLALQAPGRKRQRSARAVLADWPKTLAIQ